MLIFIKDIIKKLVIGFTHALLYTRIGKRISETMIEQARTLTQSVLHNNVKMIFSTPNYLNKGRVSTFSTKEPETLDWIDSFPEGITFWDIGANIGLFSIYAAKKKKCQVFSFEPSVFNLELLAKNISLNKLQKKITIIPLPLSNKMGPNNMRFTSTDWGGALSTFGENIGWDGKPIDNVFSFNTFGLSMDQGLSILNLPQPDFIKIDVDGIEHLILEGGSFLLKNVKGILIEVNDSFKEQADKIYNILESLEFSLIGKEQAEWSINTEFKDCYNLIWIRK